METAGIKKRYTRPLGDETLPRIHRSDFLQWLDHNKHRFSVPLVVSGVTNPRLGEQEYRVRLTFPSRPDCLQLKLVFGPRNYQRVTRLVLKVQPAGKLQLIIILNFGIRILN